MKRQLLYIIIAVSLVSMPAIALGAEIFIHSPASGLYAQDNVLVEVRLKTKGQALNTIEGLVGLQVATGQLYVRDINLGGSDVSLWPNRPSVTFYDQGASISFVGGVPGGFTKDDNLLFTIVLTATEPGAVVIAPVSVVAYAHDGQGTPVTVDMTESTITVLPERVEPRDEWRELIMADTEPPLPFTITLGQDPSVFDGQKFVTFHTTDAQSGIDYYEVKEGDFGPVRTGTTYVLQNQLRPVPISVWAYDKAGNVQLAEWHPSRSVSFVLTRNLTLFLLLVIIAISCIIVWQWRHSFSQQLRRK